MAYQNVGTPRFYVNHIEWLDSIGSGIYTYESEFVRVDANIFYTIPSSKFSLYSVGEQVYFQNISTDALSDDLNMIPYKMPDKQFLAILGHNLSGDECAISTALQGGLFTTQNNGFTLFANDGTLINIVGMGGTFVPGETGIYDLFTLIIPTPVGSIVMGGYYDMPNAPNLSLTMGREYGGTKEFTTHNGSTMSNTMWNKPTMWGNLGAWELDDGSQSLQHLAKSGRRSWDLKFSYMDDGDLWGSNQMISYIGGNIIIGLDYDDGDVDNSNNFNRNILDDDNFFSQVWHKTLGGTLPFIFQPDNTNNNPDQFAICKFKNNSLKATQSAFNVYDISLSIEEVW